MSKTNFGAMTLMMLAVGLLLAACGGGGSGSSASGGGGTLTFTGVSTASIPGLAYYAPFSSASAVSGGTVYTDYFWNITTGGLGVLSYESTTTQDVLGFMVTANSNATNAPWYFLGTVQPVNAISCWVGGASNPSGYPTCASWGVTASRVAGTITFASAPVYDPANSAVAGTMSGTLTLAPF